MSTIVPFCMASASFCFKNRCVTFSFLAPYFLGPGPIGINNIQSLLLVTVDEASSLTVYLKFGSVVLINSRFETHEANKIAMLRAIGTIFFICVVGCNVSDQR